MNEQQRLAQQQSQGSQRNVDKDNILLTENYGGLNTESSSINMPLTDSPALMNVEVLPSGILRKRRGSKLLEDSLVDQIDQIVPVKLVDGSIIFVYLSLTDISVQPDAYANSTELFSASNVFPTATNPNTSYTTVARDDFTYVYFTRGGSPPVVLEICQMEVSNTGTAITLPRNYGAADRDSSLVSNAKYLDVDGVWRNVSSINASTGATVLATTPASNGTGVFVLFHWHWAAQTFWRDKDHLQWVFTRDYTTDASCSIELSPRFKQMTINQLAPARTLLTGVWSSSAGRTFGVSWTSIAFMSSELFVSRTAAPTLGIYNSNPAPQTDTTNVALTWWVNDGARPTLGKYSSVGGNAPSVFTDDFYAALPTHILWGGNWYTDSGYSVPAPAGSAVIFNDMYIPFDAGDGAKYNEIAADTDIVPVSIFAGSTFVWQTTGFYMRLDKTASDAAGTYNTLCNTTDNGQWLSSYCGSNMGLVGQSFRVTKFTVPTGAGSGAVAGTHRLGRDSKKNGRYFTQYGLTDYMNFKTGAYANVVGTYQDRLCYAGFVSNPGTLLFSNVAASDETYFTTKKPHMNFEVLYTDAQLATSPVAVELNLGAGERIVCMQQWYDDLFVGTNTNIYRIHGGDNVAITPTTYYVSKVANVGTIRNGMVLTEDGVVFVGEAGVYKIYLDINTGSYRTTNLGLKIRPEIRKGMDNERFFNSVGRIAYDRKNNVIYVLVGNEYNSQTPSRCFVYFVDREAWSEYALYNGFMNAHAVACIDGRVFMGIHGETSSKTTFAEFNIDDTYTDLVRENSLLTTLSNLTYDLDDSKVTWSRSNYLAGSDVVLSFGGNLKVLPIPNTSHLTVETSNAEVGVPGTDYWQHKGNTMVVDGTTFWDGIETLYADVKQNETNTRYMNVYSTSDESYLTTTDLDYTDNLTVKAESGSSYINDTVTTSLSYPCWWISPAFTRNDVKDLKRVHHFYGMFQNSVLPANNTYTAPTWQALNSFDMTLIQNGTLGGATEYANAASDSLSDISYETPAWLDYFRVSIPVKGNFMSFQVCVHSFDRGQWELVGYLIDTEMEGRTSRRAYNE